MRDDDFHPYYTFNVPDDALLGDSPPIKVEIGDYSRHDRWRASYTYRVIRGEEVLFHGEDFSPSPLVDPYSDASALSLLAFITCQPGDVDDDYFADYTERQYQWAQSYECEVLAGWAHEAEDAALRDVFRDIDNDAY